MRYPMTDNNPHCSQDDTNHRSRPQSPEPDLLRLMFSVKRRIRDTEMIASRDLENEVNEAERLHLERIIAESDRDIEKTVREMANQAPATYQEAVKRILITLQVTDVQQTQDVPELMNAITGLINLFLSDLQSPIARRAIFDTLPCYLREQVSRGNTSSEVFSQSPALHHTG